MRILTRTSILCSLCYLATVSVAVTTPPKLTREPNEEIPYKKSEEIILPCDASGTPPLQYYWQRNLEHVEVDGLHIRQIAGSGTIVITPPTSEEGDDDDISGVYQCFAKNQFGTAVSVKSSVKKAYVNSFVTVTDPPRLKPLVGTYLNLTCHPPESYPKANVYWSSGKGNDIQNVPHNKRVALDYDGNLHIANIMMEDGNDYSCQSKNAFLRKTSDGDDTILEPILASPDYKAPMLVWSSPHADTPVIVAVQRKNQGETVKMMCIFSGYPTPDVKWEALGGIRPSSRTNFDSKGGLEMEIKNVKMEDAGEYTCTATSAGSDVTVSRKFTLKVEYPPRWVDDMVPEDVTASEEEDSKITCAADALPRAAWTFTFNGKTMGGGGDTQDENYVPEDDRISIQGDTVYFRNLTKVDTQVVQCNVSNTHGYLFTNVFLNVLAEPPYFIEEPDPVVKKAEGQEVILKCRVFGAPKPKITWLRGEKDEVVSGPRFTILPEGDLRITPAIIEDMNSYTCRARNKFGEMEKSGQLLIREKTSIDRHPESQVVIAGTEVSFFCNATTDEAEESRLRIKWLKNGQEIDYIKNGKISRNMRDKSLHIIVATPEDTGRYTCVASNGIDDDESTAQLTVRDHPDPPSNLHLMSCTSGRAEISWTPGNENMDEVIEFIVKYNTSFDEAGVFHIGAKVRRGQHSAQISLSPYANYTFHVLARNSLGVSDRSPYTKSKCETPARKPTHDPDWVCTSSEEPDQLVIRWKTFPPIQHNGSDFHYVVKYRRFSDPHNTEVIVNERDWRVGKMVIPNQPTYTQYEISVKTANEKGLSRGGNKWIDGFSGEDTPEVSPENFSLDDQSLNATHATFFWDPVDTSMDAVRGFFVGYRIVYWRTDDPDNTRRTEFIENEVPECPADGAVNGDRRVRRASMEEGTVADLWPYSSISAAIQVMNGGKSGALSNPPLQFQTPEGVPGPVPMFRIIEIGSHHMKVEWEKPLRPNGVITHYMISYEEVGSNPANTVFPGMIEPSRTHKKIHGLMEDTTYVVSIYAHTSKGPGAAMTDEGTTLTAAVPDMPGIEDYEVGETWVNVSWTPSEGEQKNPGMFFYVEYKKPGSDKWEKTPVEKEHNWFNVTDLEPGDTEIRIVALNGNGDEKRSDTEIIYIGQREEAQVSAASTGWFIGIMCALIFLLLILLIICLIRRNRGGKYPVYEKEKLAGRDPDKEDEEAGFGEFNKNDEPLKKPSRQSLNSEERPLESDTDSMAEYYETDPSKFNEDGSFIGQYGVKSRKPEADTTSPSALSTFV